MNGRLLLSIPLALLALAPVAAQAQTPPAPVPPAPPPAPAPAPAPAAGKASISVFKGLATKKMRYAAPFQQLVVKGRVKPYVVGQFVVLNVIHKNKLSKRIRVPVRRKGRYRIPVKLAKNGLFRLNVSARGKPHAGGFSHSQQASQGRGLAGRPGRSGAPRSFCFSAASSAWASPCR